MNELHKECINQQAEQEAQIKILKAQLKEMTAVHANDEVEKEALRFQLSKLAGARTNNG